MQQSQAQLLWDLAWKAWQKRAQQMLMVGRGQASQKQKQQQPKYNAMGLGLFLLTLVTVRYLVFLPGWLRFKRCSKI